MNGWVILDTLQLNVRYPKTDVYKKWIRAAENHSFRQKKTGVRVGDLVLRNGASGYKFSLWEHDARAFITDQVDEVVGEGSGMGIWLQFGPKFLIANSRDLKSSIKKFIRKLGVIGNWNIRVTRIDLAIDMPNSEMKDQEIEHWRKGWVGPSKMSAVYFNSRSGILETIYVGSPYSAVKLRVYDKVEQARKEGDLGFWQEVWGGHLASVTRVEWQVKVHKGGFESLVDFDCFNELKIIELLNYLLEWGRLCEPDSNDSNNRRWEISNFWAEVVEIATYWADGMFRKTVRVNKTSKDISQEYIRFVGGVLAGAMARFSPTDPNFYNFLDGMNEHGLGIEKILEKAIEKAEVLEKL